MLNPSLPAFFIDWGISVEIETSFSFKQEGPIKKKVFF